jgi:hypothetical protein
MVKLLPDDFVVTFLTLFGGTINSLESSLYHACERLIDLEQYCLVFCIGFSNYPTKNFV